MPISFVTTRELSKQPGRVLRRLGKEGPQIVTQNGRPAAYMIPASRMGIESDLEAIRLILFGRAVEALQEQAEASGASNITDEEIDAEIKAVRRARRERRARK
jgi:prevent-host-death family protein